MLKSIWIDTLNLKIHIDRYPYIYLMFVFVFLLYPWVLGLQIITNVPQSSNIN